MSLGTGTRKGNLHEGHKVFTREGPTYLVADALPVGIDLFVQQFKQPGWEELVILYVGLLGRSRSLKQKKQNLLKYPLHLKLKEQCRCKYSY